MAPSPKRKIQALGPGLLTFGEAGTSLDISAQVTSAKIEWEVNAEQAEQVLSGDRIPGSRTYSAKLSATSYQDLEANGLIDWSWKNKGAEVKFVFVPDKRGKALVEGKILVDPITLGGDVGVKNKSDFTWDCATEPVFDPASGKVTALVT